MTIPTGWQRAINNYWPAAALAIVIMAPWLIAKALTENGRNRAR